MKKRIAIACGLLIIGVTALFWLAPQIKKWSADSAAYDKAHPDVCLQTSTVTAIQPVASWRGDISDYMVTFADGSVSQAQQMVIPGAVMRGVWPPTLHIGLEYCTSWSNGRVP